MGRAAKHDCNTEQSGQRLYLYQQHHAESEGGFYRESPVFRRRVDHADTEKNMRFEPYSIIHE